MVTEAPQESPEPAPTPWYQEVWFVILLVLLALAILFVVLLFVLRQCGPRQPHIRQRMPLPPPGHKVPPDLFAVGTADARGLNAGPGVGVFNPAYSTPLPTPRRHHLAPPSPIPSISHSLNPDPNHVTPSYQAAHPAMVTSPRERGDGASGGEELELDLLHVPTQESGESDKDDNLSSCSFTSSFVTHRTVFTATHL
ncbi:uncharacterized protein LOC143281681 [Babylonia areolata]|uniref:uncharacterized protein LOC143281681 n=1 Tax=Babylonia areolata TaxID=304850 RepID=UPI003FCF5BCA